MIQQPIPYTYYEQYETQLLWHKNADIYSYYDTKILTYVDMERFREELPSKTSAQSESKYSFANNSSRQTSRLTGTATLSNDAFESGWLIYTSILCLCPIYM